MLVSVTCSAALAQQDLSGRLYERSARVNELIRQNATRLDNQTQRQVLEQLSAIETLIARGGRPNPYPGNPAPPTPPPPPGGARYLVRGDIESKGFTFEVTNLLSLYTQCTDFVKNQIGNSSVDDINISIDFGPVQKLRNSSSYWKGEAQVCNQIVEVARKSGITYDNSELAYIGTIEQQSFMFRGYSLLDINKQCESFVNSSSLSSVDDITVSVNLGPVKTLRNSSSYWKGSFEICQQILQQK